MLGGGGVFRFLLNAWLFIDPLQMMLRAEEKREKVKRQVVTRKVTRC